MSRVRSPKYPNFSLEDAVQHAGAIYEADRNYPVTREDVAKHMGYSGLSGASDKSIATMMQYGLLERISKGEVRVSQLAIDILYPENEEQRKVALREAAFTPPLFKAIKERFPEREPSEQTLRSWLLREQFNDRAINPVIRSYAQTCSYLRQENATENSVKDAEDRSHSEESGENEGADAKFGGASHGDYVQWESQGTLRFPNPLRVRHVSRDGEWVFVEGSETGIPMNEVIVKEPATESASASRVPPTFPLDPPERSAATEDGEAEWMRNTLGTDTKVRLMVKGQMGPKEIKKLIRLLEAQRAVLLDEDEEV